MNALQNVEGVPTGEVVPAPVNAEAAPDLATTKSILPDGRVMYVQRLQYKLKDGSVRTAEIKKYYTPKLPPVNEEQLRADYAAGIGAEALIKKYRIGRIRLRKILAG